LNIKNLFKNRTVLGITCIVLALVVAFVVAPIASRSGGKNVKVVRSVKDIKSGDEITKDMVSEITMSGTNQPSDTVSNINDVVGKFATMDMIKGDYVLSGKLANSPYVENTYLSGLDGTNRALSITIKAFANAMCISEYEYEYIKK
jgi:pilus assembly protein CpaB